MPLVWLLLCYNDKSASRAGNSSSLTTISTHYRQLIDGMKIFDRVLNPREIRRRLGLNQEQFWTQIGVTQSGGSRYESGREMPKPVRELLRLVHVEQVDLSQVKRVDFEIISYLKSSHPDLYRTLRRAVKGRSPSDTADVPAGLEPLAAADSIDLPLPADGPVPTQSS